MLDPATVVGRRPLLRLGAVAALGGTGVAGCATATGPAPDRADPAVHGRAPARTGVGPDEELLLAALRATDGALADLRAAAGRTPAISERLAPAIEVHQAHRAVLSTAGASPPSPAAAPSGTAPRRSPGRTDPLAQIAAREDAVASRLASLALAAASGPFARLLGSASAAVTAAATALATPEGDPRPLAVTARPLPEPTPGGRPLPGAVTADGAVDALQDVLASEHAAVWALGLLAARTSRSARPELAAALLAGHDAHRERRDLLVALLRAVGVDPVAAASTYVAPASTTAAQVTRSGWELESASAGWWAAVVAASTDATRALAVAALRDAATRGLALRGTPAAFPGADELAAA